MGLRSRQRNGEITGEITGVANAARDALSGSRDTSQAADPAQLSAKAAELEALVDGYETASS